MKLRFTDHVQFRINEREISIEEIKQAINNPDYSGIVLGGKILSKKKFGQKTLEIVYFKDGKEYVIVTAYYL